MKTKTELLKEMEADEAVLEKYFDVVIKEDDWDRLTICISDDDATVYTNSVPYKPDPVPPVAPERGKLSTIIESAKKQCPPLNTKIRFDTLELYSMGVIDKHGWLMCSDEPDGPYSCKIERWEEEL